MGRLCQQRTGHRKVLRQKRTQCADGKGRKVVWLEQGHEDSREREPWPCRVLQMKGSGLDSVPGAKEGHSKTRHWGTLLKIFS